jgi:hypothetical protein
VPAWAHAEHLIQPDIWSTLLKYFALDGGVGTKPLLVLVLVLVLVLLAL